MANIFRGPRGSCQEEDTLAAALLADCVGWLTIEDFQHTHWSVWGFFFEYFYTQYNIFFSWLFQKGKSFLNLLVLKCQPSNANIVQLSSCPPLDSESSPIWAAVCNNLSHQRMLILSLMSPLFAWEGGCWGQTGQNSWFGTCVCSVQTMLLGFTQDHMTVLLPLKL